MDAFLVRYDHSANRSKEEVLIITIIEFITYSEFHNSSMMMT